MEACGGMQHLCKATHQHHVCLRWDMKKNKACNKSLQKNLWEVKLNTQGLNQNESRGLEALKYYQLFCFCKSWLDPNASSLSWSPKRQGQELSWKATQTSSHLIISHVPHTHAATTEKIWTPHSWLFVPSERLTLEKIFSFNMLLSIFEPFPCSKIEQLGRCHLLHCIWNWAEYMGSCFTLFFVVCLFNAIPTTSV